MELKPGYKMTEVGVIPEDWETKRLGECSRFRTGPFGSALHKSDYTEDGIPVINPMHIVDGSIKPTWTMTVREQVAKQLSEFRLKPGEIIIGRRGDMGRCALVQADQNGWLCGTGSMIVRCDNGVDANFLQRILSSPQIITAITDLSVGTTMINLNQSTLARLEIQLPPLPEQRAIAQALSDVDALLATLDQVIAKKRDLKQAAMQQLLTGKTRLPGFSGEWEVKRLGNVLRFQVGFPFSSAFFNEKEKGFRLVKNRDLKTDDQVFHYSGPYDSAFLVKNGDVLVGMDGDFLPCLWKKGMALLNQRVGRIVPLAGLNLQFAYYYLLEPLKEIEIATASTTVKHLSHGDIEGIERSLPTVPEQTAIAEVLSRMDAELATLEQRRDKTRNLKQAMMQELLTGKTRLV